MWHGYFAYCFAIPPHVLPTSPTSSEKLLVGNRRSLRILPRCAIIAQCEADGFFPFSSH